MNLWHDVSVGETAPQEVNTIIETSAGSSNKYEIDKETGLIRLDRANYSGIPFPFNYGFIPQTLWHDGDAIDVVLLTTFSIPSGILVPARPIALMEMNDSGEDDAKIICVPLEDKWWDDVQDVTELSAHKQKEIKNFFETYKALKGEPVKVVTGAFKPKAEVCAAITEGQKLYKEKFSQ